MDVNVLGVPVEGVLLLADLDGAAAELFRDEYQHQRLIEWVELRCLRRRPWRRWLRHTEDTGRDSSATYLRNQDLVTGVDAHGETLAILVKEAGANSENLGLVLLLDAALREEDAGGGLGLGLDALDQDAVQEGSEVLDVAEDRLLTRKLAQLTSKKVVVAPLTEPEKVEGGRYSRPQLEPELEARLEGSDGCAKHHQEDIPL